MNKEKFDYYWKIALLIVLIIGMGIMFKEWKEIKMDSINCIQDPIEYIKEKLDKDCIINCYDIKVVDEDWRYNFDLNISNNLLGEDN